MKGVLMLLSPCNTDVIAFLTLKFGEGASYGSLNSTRSAISLISKNDLSKDALIYRYLRGCFKRRPPKPKYDTTWDTEEVLSYIERIDYLENLKLKEISEITATLLVLVTAHRLQTLAVIDIDNIQKSSAGVQIKIPDLLKTSKPGKMQPVLNIPFFRERPKVCVASAILRYLEITEKLRSGTKNFLCRQFDHTDK